MINQVDVKEIIGRCVDSTAWGVADVEGESNGGTNESMNVAEDIIAALHAAGLVIVPKEPNIKMIKAADDLEREGEDTGHRLTWTANGHWGHGMEKDAPQRIYRAMIAAAGEQG